MQRAISALCLLLALAIPAQAQGDKPRPNTLTPKEIADGWILLFDGETTFGWITQGNVRVADGALLLPGNGTRIEHGVTWGSHELRFDYRTTSEDGETSGSFWLKDTTSSFGLLMGKAEWSDIRSTFEPISNPPKYHQQMWRDGQKILDDKTLRYATVRPVFHGPRGRVDLQIRNIKLRPLVTKSIFNGKDLDGWKVFPGDKYKSKFTVTDKGEINVKDGPGDLQTVGKYQNFALQFECISNGKHLNSGIFFRCRDNEYQNGYEAQIRNQFTAEATQKYLVEEYDPKTNKLIGKKEITSTAFDYGTGAIYRRVPARKGMSRDGEWFGMTIVANGNHLATWVNGIQVTDWRDNRPTSDNARTGCKLEAGHISIQGHDPTTDLSFRNFRIAEFK